MARFVHLEAKTTRSIDHLVGFIRRPVVCHRTSAKVSCSKQLLGQPGEDEFGAVGVDSRPIDIAQIGKRDRVSEADA
jgi:hypothetical protein